MTRCVFDLYHGDPLSGASFMGDVPLFRQAYAAGWVAVFHKLTQGSGFTDPLAAGRLQAAALADLQVGGYHCMTLTDSVSSQVANFMMAVGKAPSPLLLCLDFEPVDASGTAETMASEFVNAVRMATGVWPVLYTGAGTLTLFRWTTCRPARCGSPNTAPTRSCHRGSPPGSSISIRTVRLARALKISSASDRSTRASSTAASMI
jgi:hypothetical protein